VAPLEHEGYEVHAGGLVAPLLQELLLQLGGLVAPFEQLLVHDPLTKVCPDVQALHDG